MLIDATMINEVVLKISSDSIIMTESYKLVSMVFKSNVKLYVYKEDINITNDKFFNKKNRIKAVLVTRGNPIPGFPNSEIPSVNLKLNTSPMTRD